MKPVRTIRGTMLLLDRPDVDTDQIIPQQYLKRIERTGYGQFLFYNWAHDNHGHPRPEFVTNRPEVQGAKVMVTGPNFGCGSSREHAAWAIQDWGFEAVVTPSAADIFHNNAHQIGLLVVELPDDDVRRLMEIAADPQAEVFVDLPEQTISSGAFSASFEIDPSTKERLLAGQDQIDVTLQQDEAIGAHEAARPEWMPTL